LTVDVPSVRWYIGIETYQYIKTWISVIATCNLVITAVNYCVHALVTLCLDNAQSAQVDYYTARAFSVRLSEKFTDRIIRMLVRTVYLKLHSWVAQEDFSEQQLALWMAAETIW